MDWVQPLLEVEQIRDVILLDNAGSQLVQTQVGTLFPGNRLNLETGRISIP
jgi:hypothetical protein